MRVLPILMTFVSTNVDVVGEKQFCLALEDINDYFRLNPVYAKLNVQSVE